jgi:Gp37 protein
MTIPAIQIDELDEWRDGHHYKEPIPTDIETVERALIARLQQYAKDHGGALSSVAIDHFPDRPERYRLTHQVGAVLVIFDSAQPSPHKSTTTQSSVMDTVVQHFEYNWTCAVVIRSLGWSLGAQSTGRDPGAYQVIEALRLALMGFKLPGFTQLTYRGAKFEKRDPDNGGVWYYSAFFSHYLPLVNEQRDPPWPPLKTITLEHHPTFDSNTLRQEEI